MAHPILFGGATPPPAKYVIANSIRLNGTGDYLSRTPGTVGNSRLLTISAWVKRGVLGATQDILSCEPSTGNYERLFFNVDDTLRYTAATGGVARGDYVTTRVFRDPSAWMHIVVSKDVTAGNVFIFINGVLETSFSTAVAFANQDGWWLTANPHGIGCDRYWAGTTDYLGGYLSDFYLIDGQALSASDFGKFDGNGVWVPIKYSGTYGTNGCQLEFKNSGNLGQDTSGNGNDWAVTGLTAADQMADTPTNNYATLNPLDKAPSYVSLSEGNLVYGTSNTNYWVARGPYIPPTGKYAFRATYINSTNLNAACIGLVGSPFQVANQNPQNHVSAVGYYTSGIIVVAGTPVSTVEACTTGDVIEVLCDRANSTVVFKKNGTTIATVTSCPASADFAFVTAAESSGTQWRMDFGQSGYIPSDPAFRTLCTANLPAVSIPQPSKHFNTVLYTGNGGTKAVTGLGFTPGLLWGKERSASRSHFLQNEVVGPQSYLWTDQASKEVFQHVEGYVLSFDPDGFTVVGGTTSALTVNENGGAYVAWGWKGNGAAVTNTDGSIASQVSADPSAGFSIVTASGTGSAGTIGHGLGAQLAFAIIKSRNNVATYGWNIWHQNLAGPTYFLDFNTYQQVSGGTNFSGVWSPTAFGLNASMLAAGADLVAYCFTEIPGYSKFGSFVGNGSIDGPFVHCGFQPRWLMLKCRDVGGAAYDWFIFDTATHTYNVISGGLKADLADAEASVWNCIDILSSGFKIRSTDISFNDANKTYIYAAFAEHPFGGSNVSPSPAR